MDTSKDMWWGFLSVINNHTYTHSHLRTHNHTHIHTYIHTITYTNPRYKYAFWTNNKSAIIHPSTHTHTHPPTPPSTPTQTHTDSPDLTIGRTRRQECTNMGGRGYYHFCRDGLVMLLTPLALHGIYVPSQPTLSTLLTHPLLFPLLSFSTLPDIQPSHTCAVSLKQIS